MFDFRLRERLHQFLDVRHFIASAGRDCAAFDSRTTFPSEPPQIAERYGSKPRRHTAAVALPPYLTVRKMIESQPSLNVGHLG